MMQDMDRQETIQTLKKQLFAAYKYLIEHDDQENSVKVKQLASKLLKEEFTIAFCGHFSAGKSTMINRLVGENLLPSSPIPTSANLVKVRSGEEYAKVYFKNEKPRLYLAPYDYNMVKKYCRDGDQIQEIEISHSNSPLPNHTVIMDTPGIDSADDAHRIATESALHLADLILYVMDYNHVQSELNFMFTKELEEAGKEVYLVINQVDKHSSQELSFSSFKTSVVDSFALWGVKPAGIFYTSLKNAEHEYNQFSDLQAFIADRLKKNDDLFFQGIFHALQKIIKDHIDLTKKKDELALEPYKNILNEFSAEDLDDLEDTYNRLRQEKSSLGDRDENAERDFDSEINKILSNAYLMPFQTRALAESYLASCQPKFKVGLLFTKQKTLAERQERLRLFYQDILQKTKSQLEWHIRDFLVRFLKEKRIDNKNLLAKIQNFNVHFSSEVLTDAIKMGASLSGEYVLNYTNDVANEISRIAKRCLAEIKIEILNALHDKTISMQEKVSQKSASLERYISALEQVKKYELAECLERTKLESLLTKSSKEQDDDFDLFDTEEEFDVVYGDSIDVAQVQKKSHPLMKNASQKEKTPPSAESSGRMKDTAEKLKKAALLVQTLPGFKKLKNELEEKAERLEDKGFTVALFGAFSAGKSSFANALIGEKVLPVSPNPTTAAINKIKPVDASYPHGTVVIKLKDEQAMLDEVNCALKVFAAHANNLADAIMEVEKINGELTHQEASVKTNYTFLQAFTRGYTTFTQRLGTTFHTTLAEFSDYVALEEKSCFVHWIDLYYDCPLTRKGITLVDTPGADSIHSRHTEVAFDFIKNSDAILFVTYYNHAFSKADREFLIQLGRVKDSFQLDKMFFIINAIDLADNEEDKEIVGLYVRDQLIKYGVRNPHLYSLSSLHALKEKQAKMPASSSGMSPFETSFYHFITNDLSDMAVAASENELNRVYHLIENLIAHSKEDAAVKQEKRSNIEVEKLNTHAIFAQQTSQNLENHLYQETEELIYYIKQRVFLRFNDFFKEAFNPSTLRSDERNVQKVLHHALDELLEQIGFDFAQELRATTVRLDRFAEKITMDFQTTLVEIIREINPDLSYSLFEFENKAQLHFDSAFKDIQYEQFAKAMAYFKNAKLFFEKNQNMLMRDELFRVLDAEADAYLQNERTRIQDLYGKVIENTLKGLISHMTAETDDFYLSLLSALDGGVPTSHLMELQQSFKKLI